MSKEPTNSCPGCGYLVDETMPICTECGTPNARHADEMKSVTCPDCEGRKGGNALVCGPGVSGMRWMRCSFCMGMGEVNELGKAKWERGRKVSALRCELDYSMREAAKLYGVTLLEWNEIEHGRGADLAEIEAAYNWLARQAYERQKAVTS